MQFTKFNCICYIKSEEVHILTWGEGCGLSLSQFNNKLKLSGLGQPWGDPSEKD